jgi:hypothetical protein
LPSDWRLEEPEDEEADDGEEAVPVVVSVAELPVADPDTSPELPEPTVLEEEVDEPTMPAPVVPAPVELLAAVATVALVVLSASVAPPGGIAPRASNANTPTPIAAAAPMPAAMNFLRVILACSTGGPLNLLPIQPLPRPKLQKLSGLMLPWQGQLLALRCNACSLLLV